MELSNEIARVKEALFPLLEDDSTDSERLTTELERLSETHNIAAYSLILLLLVHLRFGEPEAEGHWRAIMRHRKAMSADLGRDVGVRVALVDYFINLNRKLSNPKVIEIAMYEQIERSAVTDSLTGLYNHRHFKHLLAREIERAERYNQVKSLLFLDLDNFKEVNDTHGHIHGDMILIEVANIIGQAVRTIDMVGRYGGEEFAVLLPETDRYGAFTVGERVRRHIEDFFVSREIGGIRAPLTISGGIACYPDDAMGVEELLKKADLAMYQAKGGGKNQICLHHAERRHFIRVALTETEAVLIKQIEPADGLAEAQALNLSRGGILFRSEKPFLLGAILQIQFPKEDKQSTTLKARVVRIEETSPFYPAGTQYEVGCCFLLEKEDDERKLLDYLKDKFPGPRL